MLPRPIRVRRGRRTDVVRVIEILATSGQPVPPADRATLRRFRRLVADLGADLYVATIDERVVGLVHVSYTRQVATPARARIESLATMGDESAAGVFVRLLELSIERAVKRECHEITWLPDRANATVERVLAQTGWMRDGSLFRRSLDR